jgi:effector-binding domain-containing protein
MDMENLEIEAGFPVDEFVPGEGEIEAGQMPSGRLATCTHEGPYNEINAAYDALTNWIDGHGYEPTGVSYEIYLNDPSETPPEKLQTQLLFPLEPA